MIERLNELYLSLEDKEKKIILLMIILVFGGIIYLINYSYLYSEIENLTNLINNKQEKLVKFKAKKRLIIKKAIVIKKENKQLLKKLSLIKDDLKFLNYKIHSSDVLYITKLKFYGILESLLEFNINNNLLTSYEINKKIDNNLTKYNIKIYGKANCNDYPSLLNYLIKINELRYIKNIPYFNIKDENNTLDYFIEVNFWSI